MLLLVDALSAAMAVIAAALISANLYVMVATALHRRKSAMRVLAHFSRAVMMLRLSDSVAPSRPYHRRQPLNLPYFGMVSLFWVAVLGSLSVEIGSCYRAMANAEGDLPDRYRKLPYLVVRTILAFASAAVAIALDAKNPLTAFYLGASAPIVLDKLAQGALPTIPVKLPRHDD